MKKVILITMIIIISFGSLFATDNSNLDKANMYYEYELIDKAKTEYIDQIFSNDLSNNEMAEAYYQLGLIAFNENNLKLAISTWENLISMYPSSSYSQTVKTQLKTLESVVGENLDTQINNSVASSFIKNGDFWSKDKDTIFSIDGSWIPNVETSCYWYDKVINNYPNSNASELAYKKKLLTILGWQESGRYGSSYGIKEDYSKYLPYLLSTFSEFEKSFPNSALLQPFRYQIAQTYWNNKDWSNTRKWLNIIINEAQNNDSFYSQLAKLRLEKVEY
jgi:tetratricopeptide (TPR) repeat protein